MPATYSKETALEHYRIAYASRQASLIGRTEVLTGKAKFGIFGDGKEVAQLAMASVFQKGDFRSGYYRDQTFLFALGAATVEQFFAQLYADPDPSHDTFSAGRQMNGHFATHLLNEDGDWLELTDRYNSAADLSPVSSQMPRLVGLAQASRMYRELDGLSHMTGFSNNGDEIAFGTIGNAGCAEGMFWEAINAVGVIRSPMLLSIWDDDYGISVSNEFQHSKRDLSALLAGFRREQGSDEGLDLYQVVGWDYPALLEVYARAAEKVRREHIPAIIHVTDMTQPQGHSTSGSHERYKSAERLAWEADHDCLGRMRAWLLAEGIVDEESLEALEKQELESVRESQRRAWSEFVEPIRDELRTAVELCTAVAQGSSRADAVHQTLAELEKIPTPFRRFIRAATHEVLLTTHDEDIPAKVKLIEWVAEQDRRNEDRYDSHLYSETAQAATRIPVVEPQYGDDSPELNGYEIVNRGFDAAFARIPELVTFGEDTGYLGDVNQGMAGMQKKYGALRVADTGIRECTIAGQAIGLALRGIRPIAEIQYLDYLHYALQIISDDLASLRYRTRGRQKAPVIIRTRGHRLEGIWHSGSLMAGILHLVRGVWVCVPRNMTQAVGMYNTLLASDDSAIVVEVLNGYRRKERLPDNVGEFTVPLGVPEVLREGTDVTVVTYGASCVVAIDAAQRLSRFGIEAEVIDVQTLSPFDSTGVIGRSLEKTNRIVFLDEDVPGGTTAYMMQQVLEDQGGYHWLDSEPRTLPGKEHRPAYGSDGDYWSKPNVETVFDAIYELMHEAKPERYPIFYR